jgi:hypothetical protein
LSFRFRRFIMLHPCRELGAHHGRNPKIGSYQIRSARRDLPIRISALSGTSDVFATISLSR